MSDVGREEFEERWAAQVGRFAMALGEIEWATDILLTAAGCSFKKEASLAVRLCLLRENIGNLKPGIGAEVERVVGEADELRDRRNSVLHSGIAFNIFTDGTAVSIEAFINDRRDRYKDIDLDSMRRLAAQAQQLSKDFWAVVLRQTGN
ncbi:TPA: hypothetical protein QEM95_08880 [Stenotrophomonas maltophilia]|nr:hypothetical protein [Stenotrophomonas maltophilia]